MTGADGGERGPGCAVLLHGLIGTSKVGPSASLDHGVLDVAHAQNGSAARSMRELIDATARALHTHLLGLNIGTDVFAHSWNPEAAPWVRAAYGASLRFSRHEVLEVEPKARSQALSIGRAAQLMLAHEAARGAPYRLALVMRHDLMLLAPVRLSALAHTALTFSHWCCKIAPWHRGRPSCAANVSAAAAAVLGNCSVDRYSYNRRKRSGTTNANYFAMDWWFAAAPAVAASWMNISTEWDAYARANAALGIGNTWGHFIWAQHARDVLRARVRYSSAVCGQLARVHLHGVRGSRRREPREVCGESERDRNELDTAQPCPASRRCATAVPSTHRMNTE